MSQKANKALLSEKVSNLLNAGINEKVVREFIDAVIRVTNPNAIDNLTPKQVDNVFKSIEHCDAACGFGPGHQSITHCSIRGPHGDHYSRSYVHGGIEWEDAKIKQTYTDCVGKTWRLGFSDEGWY